MQSMKIGRVAREVRDVLDEVDEDGLGPLQVVDDHDLRPLRARALRAVVEKRAASLPETCR